MKACVPVALAIALMIQRTASACDCDPPPLKVALEHADVVFTGFVVGVRLAEKKPEGEVRTVVELQVEDRWKNAASSTLTLHTHRNLDSCEGFEFHAGERYLVFARRNSNLESTRYGLPAGTVTYGVTLCGGTMSFRGPLARTWESQLRKLARTSIRSLSSPTAGERRPSGGGRKHNTTDE